MCVVFLTPRVIASDIVIASHILPFISRVLSQ